MADLFILDLPPALKWLIFLFEKSDIDGRILKKKKRNIMDKEIFLIQQILSITLYVPYTLVCFQLSERRHAKASAF